MEYHCPRCGCEAVEAVPTLHKSSGEAVRMECAKCKRFAGWKAAPPRNAEPDPPSAPVAAPVPAPTATAAPPAAAPFEPLAPAELWLYASKRLDLKWLPNVSLWSGEVIAFGPEARTVPFFRLSPTLLVWLERAGAHLERECLAGAVAWDQLDAYLDAMRDVWAFAERHIDPAAVHAARTTKPELPGCRCE
jgi:hypothetical protein